MKQGILAAVAVMAGMGLAPAAQAATFPVGSPNFQATPGPGGIFTANLGNNGITAGAFTDTFTFTLPASGLGSGTVSTSATVFGSSTDTDLTSVFINGVMAEITRTENNLFEVAFANSVPITAGTLNSLIVNGVSRGGGAYGGQLTFVPTATPAVPEPSTWAMLLVGFGLTGAAMRYRRRSTKIAYA